ncbi:MAG: TolC family protein [Kiritimatiellaeota bacterium]|nr:TolC family protein [Kiritimatiellota bacterium]
MKPHPAIPQPARGRRPRFHGAVLVRLGGIALVLACRAPLRAASFPPLTRPNVARLIAAERDGAADTATLPSPLTLEAAKTAALRGNPGLAAAAARVRAASALVLENSAAFYPTVTATAGASRTQDIRTRGTDGDVDPYETYSAGVAVSWLVFDGFNRRFRTLAAKYNRQATVFLRDEARRLLLKAVTVAYHNALLAADNMRISRQDAEFNRQLTREAQKRLEAGAAARSEVLNFEIRAARADFRLLSAEEALNITRIVLAELLGLSGAVLPADLVFAPVADVKGAVELPPLEREVTFAFSHRPDLLEIEQRIQEARAVLTATRSAFWPQVSLEAAYDESRQGSPVFHDEEDAASSAGIVLRWDLFSGGSTRFACRRVAEQVRAALADLDQQRIRVISEVRQQLEHLRVVRSQLQLQKRIYAMTVQTRDLVRIEYLAGRASLTRLNEAQADLVRADGNLARARIQLRQSMEDLNAVTGRDLARYDSPESAPTAGKEK